MQYADFVDEMFADDSIDSVSREAIYTLAPLLEGHDVPPPPSDENNLDGWDEWVNVVTGSGLFSCDEREVINPALRQILRGEYDDSPWTDAPESTDLIVRLQDVVARRKGRPATRQDQQLEEAKVSAEQARVALEAIVEHLDDPRRISMQTVERLAGETIASIKEIRDAASERRKMV